MTELSGSTVLVGGSGAFAAIAALVEAGAGVVLQAQTPEEIQTARTTAAELGDAVKVALGPVASFADAESLVERLAEERGGIAALLTPLVPRAATPLDQVRQATWTDFKLSYLTRAVALTRAASARMARQPEGGRVVVFGSATTFLSTGVAQAATHAALLSLVSAASAGLRETPVRVNGILLGAPGADQGGIPAPRTDDAPDVLGPATVWLAGTASQGVNGKFVYVGGRDIGFYTMPMLMENANVQVRFDDVPQAKDVADLLNPLVEIGKVQRTA